MYWTPKRLKELKERGYKLHSSPSSLVKKSDQTISLTLADGCNGSVRSGPGLKPQASSDKHQAASHKRQASSSKLVE